MSVCPAAGASRGALSRATWGRGLWRGSELSERGSVTAEFATVVPAVLLVLAACLAGMQLSTQQARLQQAAAMAARSVARGEVAAVSALVPGAVLRVERRGELACVTASARGSAMAGLLGGLTVSASSCALDGGR